MLVQLSDELELFSADERRVRLIGAVLQSIDGCGTYRVASASVGSTIPMPSVKGVDPAGQAVAEIAGHLDGGELYTGVATSARTALSLFDAHVDWASGINDLEDEHGRDAVIRLVGLGLVAEALCEGDSDASAEQFLTTDSGRAMLAWFAAVEVGLAFAAPDDPIDADKLLELLDSFFDEAVDAWAELANERSLARARIIVNNWTDWLGPVISDASACVERIAKAVHAALGADGLDSEALLEESASLVVYRGLVARHVGEHVNGALDAASEASKPVEPAPIESGTAEDHGETIRGQLETVRTSVVDLQEGISALERARATDSDRAAGIASSQTDIMAKTQGLKATLTELKKQRSAHAKTAGKHAVAKDRLLLKCDEVAEAMADARARAEAARTALPAVESPEADPDLRAAVRACRQAELGATQRVVSVLQAGLEAQRGIQSVASLSEQGVASRIEECLSASERTRQRIAELRSRRRTAVRAQTSDKKRNQKLMAAVESAREELEHAKRMARLKRDEQAPFAKSIRTLVDKQRKRENRCRDLQQRAAENDALVDTISVDIAELRTHIGGVSSRIHTRRLAQEEERQLLREDVQVDLGRERHRLDEAQTALGPAESLSSSLAERLAGVAVSHEAAETASGVARESLEQLKTDSAELVQGRERTVQLAIAARDMLRTCAGRLEEAHSSLREVQASADRLEKEHRLRADRLRDSDRSIQQSESSETEAEQLIDSVKAEIEALTAALVRNGRAQDDAKAALKESRRARAQAIRGDIADQHQRVTFLRERIAEAHDDKDGLGSAESRVGDQRMAVIASREAVRARQETLLGERTRAENVSNRHSKAVSRAQERLSHANSALLGARLTLDGCIGQRDRLKGAVAIGRGRCDMLEHGLEEARSTESQRVEAVADADAWVERTRTALAALEARLAPPKVPPPPRVEPAPERMTSAPSPSASKLDQLLQKVSANPGHVEDVPDPSAALDVDGASTMMFDRRSMAPSQQPDADATQVLKRTPDAREAEAATEMFTPQDLVARLEEESEDATVMMPRTRRRPVRQRTDDED